MVNPLNWEKNSCQKFRDLLESLPAGKEIRRGMEEWRAVLPQEDTRHLGLCRDCLQALEDMVETREALAGYEAPVPGPWFKTKVMAAIAAQEREEEAQDGVWISVRRLAPRAVALSALLLVLGGSWAVQQRNRDLTNGRSADIVGDASGTQNLYDDVSVNLLEARP